MISRIFFGAKNGSLNAQVRRLFTVTCVFAVSLNIYFERMFHAFFLIAK